ncbi:MAG: hemerythrin domain-containing protein [Gammaproteobacteria bacterium]
MPQKPVAAVPGAQSLPADPSSDLAIPALLDLILDTHHVYVRDALPRMQERAVSIPTADLQRDERLTKVREAVDALSDEMLTHMHREETMLFPVLRQIAGSTGVSPVDMQIILPPIECMQREHGFIDELLDYLRQLTDDFQPPAWAVSEHRELLDELAMFAADTTEHVRKENEVLFPKALGLA